MRTTNSFYRNVDKITEKFVISIACFSFVYFLHNHRNNTSGSGLLRIFGTTCYYSSSFSLLVAYSSFRSHCGLILSFHHRLDITLRQKVLSQKYLDTRVIGKKLKMLTHTRNCTCLGQTEIWVDKSHIKPQHYIPHYRSLLSRREENWEVSTKVSLGQFSLNRIRLKWVSNPFRVSYLSCYGLMSIFRIGIIKSLVQCFYSYFTGCPVRSQAPESNTNLKTKIRISVSKGTRSSRRITGVPPPHCPGVK